LSDEPGLGRWAHRGQGQRDFRRTAEQVRRRRVGGVHVRGRTGAGPRTVATGHRDRRHSHPGAWPALLVPAVRHVLRPARRTRALHQLQVGQRHAGRVQSAKARVRTQQCHHVV